MENHIKEVTLITSNELTIKENKERNFGKLFNINNERFKKQKCQHLCKWATQ